MNKNLIVAAALASLLMSPAVSYAEDDNDTSKADLERRVEELELELQALKDALSESADETVAQETEPEAADAGMAPPPASSPPRQRGIWSNVYWHLAGYADAGLILSDEGAGEGAEDTFFAGHFNPGFHFQYKDLVLFEGEIELEIEDDGETALELEYTQIDILLHDYATLVVGKFLSPVGQFQERLHPTWINKLADAPAGFGHDGAQPASEVGVQLRGGIPLGGTTVNYAIAVGNGPRFGHEGNVEFEGFGSDDNDNKAFSGRLGFLPLPYLEVGASFLTAEISGVGGHRHGEHEEPMPDPTDADVFLWGVDAAYTRGPWDVRFEYLDVERDPIFSATEEVHEVTLLETLEQQAWYAQIAYRLSGLTDHRVLGNFEPVFRYGELNIEGFEELEEHAAEHRYDFGLNYWIAPSIVARGVVQWREFTGGGGGHGDEHAAEEEEDHHEEEGDNTDVRYLFQVAYGF